MKLLYATSIQYPSPYANRIQILSTAEALRKLLGDSFVLAGNRFDHNEFYQGRVLESHSRFGPTLVWQQLSFARREGFNTIFSRELNLLLLHMLLNFFWFRLPLRFICEAHELDLSWRARIVLPRVSHVFCITSPLRDDLIERLPDASASVLPDAVDVVRFKQSESKEVARRRLGLSLDAHIALYVGELDIWKGIQTLYRAAELLPSHFQIAVIGGRTWQIAEFSVEHPKVRFLGSSPYELLPNNMAAADILVLPNTATEVLSARYTSPLKLFAYMTSGVPIIASNIPSLREILNEHNAVLVAPDDAHALALGIQSVAENQPFGAMLAEQARKDVSGHTWEARAADIISSLQ